MMSGISGNDAAVGVPWTEVATVALTSISAILAVVAIVVAVRANGKAAEANRIAEVGNDIAKRAVDDAAAAPIEVAWDELIAALGRMQTFDPATSKQDAGPLFSEVRIQAVRLVDRLPWDGFDKWLAVELQ